MDNAKEADGLPDGSVVMDGNGDLWFYCSYRRGIRRAVPLNYEGGKVIMIMSEFTEEHRWPVTIYVPPRATIDVSVGDDML